MLVYTIKILFIAFLIIVLYEKCNSCNSQKEENTVRSKVECDSSLCPVNPSDTHSSYNNINTFTSRLPYKKDVIPMNQA